MSSCFVACPKCQTVYVKALPFVFVCCGIELSGDSYDEESYFLNQKAFASESPNLKTLIEKGQVMAEKKTTEATVPAWKQRAENARPVKAFTETWIGMSPSMMDATIDPASVQQLELESLVDTEITIFGYSIRSGTHGEFVVMSCVPEGFDGPAVVVTGAQVIVRKLKLVGEKSGFPIKGIIKKGEGTHGQYYDIV